MCALHAPQETAQHAFQFCLKYQRKTEFRRLCDLLRQHLQNVQKYGNQANSINLNNPEYVSYHAQPSTIPSLSTLFNRDCASPIH